MMSTVIGGAMLPHALQFFTMPETEDKAVVAHVREVAADIGSRLPQEQREALVKLDLRSMVKMGAHPLAPFLAPFINCVPGRSCRLSGCGRNPQRSQGGATPANVE